MGMDLGHWFAGLATMFVLSTCIVLFGGVVPRQYQTWTVITIGAFAIPIFMVVMNGFVGIFLG